MARLASANETIRSQSGSITSLTQQLEEARAAQVVTEVPSDVVDRCQWHAFTYVYRLCRYISITSFAGDITAVDGASPIDVLLAVDSKLNADTDIMPLAAQTVCKVP